MYLSYKKLWMAAWIFCAVVSSISHAEELQLPVLHADAAKTSVSGLSSGGFMASQYGVIYSSNVVGVGIVAGGPFACRPANTPFNLPGYVLPAIQTCMIGSPEGRISLAYTKGLSSSIDGLDNIKRQKIYIFTGTKDVTVRSSAVHANVDFYKEVGVPEHNIRYISDLPAGHAFIFPTGTANKCDESVSPYIDKCELHPHLWYDQPKEVLRFIYGKLEQPSLELSSKAAQFSQKEFSTITNSLGDTGYIYVPKSCETDSKQCAVHVVFHGCNQNEAEIDGAIVGSNAYNRWADSNNIIVLYPQVEKMIGINPDGCWDWWGYSSLYFLTRSGPQVSAIRAMVDRLTTP